MSMRTVLIALLCFYCVLCFVIVVASSENVKSDEKEKIEMFEPRRRKKHTKYFVPLLTAALLIKSVLFPLAFKSMAIMAGISIILSTLSLLVSSMVGFAKTAKDSYQHATRRTQQNGVTDKLPDGEIITEDFVNYDMKQNGGFNGVGSTGSRLVLTPKLKTYKSNNFI